MSCGRNVRFYRRFLWRNYNFWGREVGEKTTILDSYLDENERGGIRGNQPKLVIFGCTLNLSNFKKKKNKENLEIFRKMIG